MPKMVEGKTPYEWASHYLNLGLSVIPVVHLNLNEPEELKIKRKAPVVNWTVYQERLPTDTELHEWFDNKFTRMGFVCGKSSGIIVVDVDPRNGGTVDGLQSQIMVKSPSGGWHYYFKYSPEIVSSKPRIGIDCQSDGKFVVAPPSLHWKSAPDNLLRYEWGLFSFDREMLDEPPEWLKNASKKNVNLNEVLTKDILNGHRDETLTQIAGSLIARYPQKDWTSTVLPILQSLNLTKTKPPLSAWEIEKIFLSITKKQINSHPQELKQEKQPIIIKPLYQIVAEEKESDEMSFPTGLKTLDDWTCGGITCGDLWILAGEPGSGKTLLAQTITYSLVNNGIPTLWFSYEMPKRQMEERFKQIGCGGNNLLLSAAEYTQDDVEWIEQAIIVAKNQSDIQVVFIDHLSFLAPKPDKNAPDQNFAGYLHAVARQLKRVAVKQKVAVILLQHTNMASQGKLSKHDLGDSKATSKECDVLFFVKKLLKDNLENKEKSSFLKERKDKLLVDIEQTHEEEATGFGVIVVDKVRKLNGKNGAFTIKLNEQNRFIDYKNYKDNLTNTILL